MAFVRLLLAAVALLSSQGESQDIGKHQPTLELSCRVFGAETSEVDLIRRFGAVNVTSDSVYGFDDGPQVGSIVYRDEADARVEVIWGDPAERGRPVLVKVLGARWRTPNGVFVGTDLRALERANGRPFRIRGLWAEGGGGGAVISWAGGRLNRPPSDEDCEINIYLQPAYDGSEPAGLVRQIAPGREFSSGHPAFQKLNPRVVVLAIFFPRRAG